MTESCRLITEEQYKEWKASEKKLAELKQELNERFPYNCFTARLERECLQKKLDIAVRALEEIMDGVGSGKYNDYAIMCCANDAFCKIKGGKYDLGRT